MSIMNSFKPKPQCPDCPRQTVLNCMDKPPNQKTAGYSESDNSSSNWDSDTTSSTSSFSTSSNNVMGGSATDPLPLHPYTKFQNIQIKKVSDMVRQASINDDLSQGPDSDLENFIQGKIGVSAGTSGGGHSSKSEETTSSDFFSDYSDTDMKCLLQKEEGTSSDSNEDFEHFKETLGDGTGAGAGTGRRTGTMTGPAQTEGNGNEEGDGWINGSDGSGEITSNSSSMIDGDEIMACIVDPELKENSVDLKYRRKDAVNSEESDGINLYKDDSLDSESDSNSGSDTESNSETVVSTLHAMMDTLESKKEGLVSGQKVSSLDLKMVEGQMETFKNTLLSGIDEDLAKWRAQRWKSKHNLARAFSIFAAVVAVVSVVATFFYDD